MAVAVKQSKPVVPVGQRFKEVVDWYASHPWSGEKGWHRMTITAADYGLLQERIRTKTMDGWTLWMTGEELAAQGKTGRLVAVLYQNRKGVKITDPCVVEEEPNLH